MKQKLFILTLLITVSLGCKKSGVEYQKKAGEITWIDISTADQISNKDAKMYFIDMYTDWCGWCKVMDNKTFTDPTIIKYMDEHFHSVKFDAEQKESVTFNNKEYKWLPQGRNGINELAVDLLQGRMSYPSYVFLDKDKKFITIVSGYLPPEKFIKELESVTQK